jgi:hypothetical protein
MFPYKTKKATPVLEKVLKSPYHTVQDMCNYGHVEAMSQRQTSAFNAVRFFIKFTLLHSFQPLWTLLITKDHSK